MLELDRSGCESDQYSIQVSLYLLYRTNKVNKFGNQDNIANNSGT